MMNPNDVLAAYFNYRGTTNVPALHEAVDTELWPNVGIEYRKEIADLYGTMSESSRALHKALGRLVEAKHFDEADFDRIRAVLKGHHRSHVIYFRAVAEAAGDAELKHRAERIADAQGAYVEAWRQAVQCESAAQVNAALENTLGRHLEQTAAALH